MMRGALAVAAACALLTVPAIAAAAVPASPVLLAPRGSALVSSHFTITGRVGPGVVDVVIGGAVASTVTVLPADSAGATFTAEVRVRYGRSVITVTASDGAASSGPAALTVWQLGATPASNRFVLVDKSDFMLYAVRGGIVQAAYPIATGTRGTPTPVGTRYLGRPGRAPNAVWGAFRMRLYKKALVRVAYTVRVAGHRVKRYHKVLRYVATRYYIHGTNDPDSIGTPASHGCIRLWNSNLRAFSKLTVMHELTVIRS
jgi:lipoprotein-anchoring transpeptidase ErfK/SrfK